VISGRVVGGGPWFVFSVQGVAPGDAVCTENARCTGGGHLDG
jgi:hypothetical protein